MKLSFDEMRNKIIMIQSNYEKRPDAAPILCCVHIRTDDKDLVNLFSHGIVDFYDGKTIKYDNGRFDDIIPLSNVMNLKIVRVPNYIQTFCFVHQLNEALEKVINEYNTPVPTKEQRLATLSYVINEMKES